MSSINATASIFCKHRLDMIVVAGSSWGCGEWTATPEGKSVVTHGGLAQYLTENNYDVLNISKGNISNIEVLERLDISLEIAELLKKDISKIFVFVSRYETDFIYKNHNLLLHLSKNKIWVDIFGYHLAPDDDPFTVFNITSPAELERHLTLNFYNRLSNLAKKYNTDIHLIGSNVDIVLSNPLPDRITVACQSHINLLHCQTDQIENPVLGLYMEPEYQEWIYKMFPKHLPEITDLFDKAVKRTNDIKKSNFSAPDRFHVGRDGYKILFNFLKDKSYI